MGSWSRKQSTGGVLTSLISSEGQMSSGTRKGWAPARFPADGVAAQRLREWLDAGEGGLDAVRLDLSGADLSHGDFSESWFTDSKLMNVTLVSSELYRSDAQGADLRGADRDPAGRDPRRGQSCKGVALRRRCFRRQLSRYPVHGCFSLGSRFSRRGHR